jgi:hypothetical protein
MTQQANAGAATAPAVTGKSGLSKDQLIAYFRRKFESQDNRPDVSKLLYEADDFSLITEIHAQMVLPLVGMAVYEAALDLKRTEPLITIWKREYFKIMVSFERKGRLEYLGALNALAFDEGSDEGKATRV